VNGTIVARQKYMTYEQIKDILDKEKFNA